MTPASRSVRSGRTGPRSASAAAARRRVGTAAHQGRARDRRGAGGAVTTPTPRSSVRWPDAHLDRTPLSPRRGIRRRRNELRPVHGGRRERRPRPPPRRRHPRHGHHDRGRRLRMALLSACCRPRPVLRLPGARPVGPGGGPPLQPREAAPRPVRHRRRRADGQRPLTLRADGKRTVPGRQRAAHPRRRGDRQRLRLGQRPPAPAPVRRQRHLRGPRSRPDPHPSQGPRETARHLRGPRAPGGRRAPDLAGRDRGRTDAGAPVRAGRIPARPGSVELLGLQHDRLLRPAQRVRLPGQPRRAGHRVQVDGEGAARGQASK